MAVDALRVMRRTADRLVALGVSQSHDLSGTVFQRLIADRKFLATFYTRPESAALLAHLAIPDDGGWDDVERVKDFRIAGLRLRDGHADPRGVPSAEPAPLASGRRAGEAARAHGYAGLASWFVALADRMVRKNGTVAMVLPMTALQGISWQKARQVIARSYSDVTLLTIASSRQDDQSFSADTGMAETLIVCRESSDAPDGRGRFVSLRRRPDSEMEATEIARAMRYASETLPVRAIEDGPFSGNPLLVGDDQIGEMIDAPLSMDSAGEVRILSRKQLEV